MLLLLVGNHLKTNVEEKISFEDVEQTLLKTMRDEMKVVVGRILER